MKEESNYLCKIVKNIITQIEWRMKEYILRYIVNWLWDEIGYSL